MENLRNVREMKRGARRVDVLVVFTAWLLETMKRALRVVPENTGKTLFPTTFIVRNNEN